MPFQYDLTRLQNREQLIGFLELNEGFFEDVLAFAPGTRRDTEYSDKGITLIGPLLFHRHEIPKKNRRRGYRTVWEPTFLKNNYKALARRLNDFFAHKLEGFPHARTFGYIGGRNIKENAQDHCGHRNLISLDPKDFFPSIKALRIGAFLQSIGIVPNRRGSARPLRHNRRISSPWTADQSHHRQRHLPTNGCGTRNSGPQVWGGVFPIC
jgi:RNA-directed DNA polymerase